MVKKLEKVYFGGGCFWCTEAVFRELKGVVSVTPGYADGHTENPTYEEVRRGDTGHAEVIQIAYDPEQIPFYSLLTVFFATHDPTTRNRQGDDIGTQYRSLILYTTLEQKEEAERCMHAPMVTELKQFKKFYEAESYHKNYYEKNKEKPYCHVVISPKLMKLKATYPDLLKLSPELYRVAREKGTEAPFSGKYVRTHDKGIYTCAICGTELFSSDTKFDSGTGWPSFTNPMHMAHIALKKDTSLGMERQEVLCKKCGAHLGHVFDDGPKEKRLPAGRQGKRYCINSVCLAFEKENHHERSKG